MSKLITSALIAAVLVTGGLQTTNAQTVEGDSSGDDNREAVCRTLQRNCG